MRVNHEFGPYIDRDSRVLILGSIPSLKSREYGFYYMHKQNRFWKVISDIFDDKFPDSLSDKKEFLRKNKIALWDVLESCDIEGSSDSSIKNPKVNDIKSLILGTDIKYIFVTGKKAFDLYNKYCFKSVGIEAIYLPSTSGANRQISYADLKEKYEIIKKCVKN